MIFLILVTREDEEEKETPEKDPKSMPVTEENFIITERKKRQMHPQLPLHQCQCV